MVFWVSYFFDNHKHNITTIKKKKKNFMIAFYGWGSTASGYSHFEEAVYFLPLSSQKFLVLILSTS